MALPDPIDFEPGLTSKQKQLVIEMKDLATCFYFAEEQGLRTSQKSLSYALKVRFHEFMTLDAERLRKEAPV